MPLLFEWDEDKAESNWRKHKVTFDEAQTVFLDNLSITVPDARHSQAEVRFRIVGISNLRRLVVVSFTERGERIRLINARKASRSEIRDYEEKDFN
ncbi:MAG TPA: BrnT family toxin [Pyrinomonadaceae bacterium]|nr:BrnT family toxin [Pyrinomonadaceae bacterium]